VKRVESHMKGVKSMVALGLAAVLCAAVPQTGGPLIDAARNGDAEAVRSLFAEVADANMAQGDGMTALHWAAERGHAAVADLLLSADAAVQAKTRIGSYTPLHLSSRGGHGSRMRSSMRAPISVRPPRAAASPPSTSRPPPWTVRRSSPNSCDEAPTWTPVRRRRARPR